MNKSLGWKFALVALVTAWCLYALQHYGIRQGLDLKGGTSFLLRMDLSGIEKAGHAEAIREGMNVISRRVDQFGVAEPIIQAVGEDRILVQLPGLAEKDRQQARRTIEQAAFLEFRLVHKDNDQLQADAVSNPRFVPPLGYTNLTRVDQAEGREIRRSYFVRLKAELGGKAVQRAFVQFDDMGRPYVALKFTDEGAQTFARVTAANVGRQLAIVLDGELQSAPVIQDAITGGNAQISGSFSLPEAKSLASVLENPLEAPVKILEERGVDPSLGKDSIASGKQAALIGAGVVVVFMPLYYYLAGGVAVVAMGLNLLVLFGALAMFGFTLTLPGIAGIVLTIGMSVDANVLINERIREELGAGKPLRAAIEAGYKRAFLVIFDSNLTTILSGVLLIWLGSGPVKGFGVSLSIGLLANMLTAVFFTRIVFEWLVQQGWLTSFKMQNWVPVTKINFLGLRPAAFAVTLLVVAIGAYSFFDQGGHHVGRGKLYGVDFTGGDALTLSYAEKVEQTQLRQSLDQLGYGEAFIQYQSDLAGGHSVLTIKVPEGASEKVVPALQQAYPAAKLNVLSTDRVGATVGKELLKQALEAIGLSLLVIMIYIAIRFGEFAYGVGALVSLLVGVLVTVGIFCLAGRTFSQTIVAAVLTIIGYAINDTIVVFDRIREDRKLTAGRLGYFDLINRSINETLSRTVITGGATILGTVALILFGGPVLFDFSFTFLVGMLSGTFCSIFIASPIVYWFHRQETNRNRPAPAKA
jgi:SecD/SecF fusion protein